MNITFDADAVLKDGKEVGVVDEKNAFHPVKGLHHKTAAAIEKELLKQGGQEASRLAHTQESAGSIPAPATKHAKASDEPARTHLGDIDPELIEWRRESWPEADFAALYPPARLRQLGL